MTDTNEKRSGIIVKGGAQPATVPITGSIQTSTAPQPPKSSGQSVKK